jgi:hypothetical protein
VRLKKFGILGGKFRHSKYLKAKHGQAFHAITVITQLSLRRGQMTYKVKYNDRRAL